MSEKDITFVIFEFNVHVSIYYIYACIYLYMYAHIFRNDFCATLESTGAKETSLIFF